MTILKRTQVALVALLIVIATLSAAPAQTPSSLSDPIPVDRQIAIGTLPNGIKYYVRANSRPEKRAELRLVVKAGSVLEDDEQQGLAHFVEHMALTAPSISPRTKSLSSSNR